MPSNSLPNKGSSPRSHVHRKNRIAALLTVGRYGKPPRASKPRRPRPGAVVDKPPHPGDPRWPDYQRSRGEW